MPLNLGVGVGGFLKKISQQCFSLQKIMLYDIYFFQILDRAHSMGALNFGYVSDDGILRGSVTPFMHFTNNNESKQSLGQYSDHIDEYRDVAL